MTPQAGFWIGIASLVLAVVATLFWVLFVVLAATDDEFLDDLERELDESGGGSLSVVCGGAFAARAALGVLA